MTSASRRARTWGGRNADHARRRVKKCQVTGYSDGLGDTVCKTVGSAYVGSNPTPATMKSPRSLAYAQPYDWEIDGTARRHGLFCVSARFRRSGAWTLKTHRRQLASRSRYGDVGLSRDLIHLIRTVRPTHCRARGARGPRPDPSDHAR